MTTTAPHRPAPPADDQPYVLGTGADEMFRLGLQHRLWSASAHALWERAGIQPGWSVMDVGSGPGYAALDLAQIVGPAGRVIAVDESAAFLKQLHDYARARRLENIDRVLGDVHDLDSVIENGDGTLDAAYARWVFCFCAEPEVVVKGLARLLKPGGRIAVQDYFNYERSLTLAPRCEAFSKVIHAVGASWRSRGGSPDVMGSLPGVLSRHGFDITHMDVVQRVARPGSQMWHWPETFWDSFLPKLVESGFITAADRDAFLAAWKRAATTPGAFVQLPPVYELIAVKKG